MAQTKKAPKRIRTGSVELWCRRLERLLPVEEHCACLYCFGSEEEIRSGDHAKFCDFDPRKDPINFGFPDGGGWVDEK